MSDTVSAEKLAKIENRVQKLIAQAESTNSADEAATFMAAAEELMAAYAIDRAKLEDNTGQKTEFIQISFQYPHAAMYWATDKVSAATINKAIGLCGLAVTNNAKLIWLYGTTHDVEYTRTIILSVWKQQRRHMRLWKKITPHVRMLDGVDLRNVEKGFYIGFAKGAADKITETRQSVESSTNGALVLASRMQEISDFMGGNGVRRRSVGRRVNYSGIGYSEGQVRGKSASFGPEIGGPNRSLTS